LQEPKHKKPENEKKDAEREAGGKAKRHKRKDSEERPPESEDDRKSLTMQDLLADLELD
jgi:hypothetical protein